MFALAKFVSVAPKYDFNIHLIEASDWIGLHEKHTHVQKSQTLEKLVHHDVCFVLISIWYPSNMVASNFHGCWTIGHTRTYLYSSIFLSSFPANVLSHPQFKANITSLGSQNLVDQHLFSACENIVNICVNIGKCMCECRYQNEVASWRKGTATPVWIIQEMFQDN